MKIVETSIGADAAKLAGLQIDLLQKIRSGNGQITLGHLEWFLGLTKEGRDQLSGVRITDYSRFKLINTFELTVPRDYVHETQLALFSKNHKKDFYYYNGNITDENFAKVTDKLVPGKTYNVKIFGITELVSSEDILAFLKIQPGIRFIGAQGLSLVCQENKEKFPTGKYTISIDAKDTLWEDAGGFRRVPRVRRYSGGGWNFGLGSFGGGWDGDGCLLCFCDLSDK